jgi:hypothetical protein
MQNLMEKAGPQQAGAQPPMPEDEAVDVGNPDEHPAYNEAITLAKRKLYEEGAGEGLMKALQTAPEIGAALAEQTFAMMEMLDQMTEGQVPDELVMTLGIELMGEVVEIAEAGGVEVAGRDMAAGMRALITKLVTALGGDMTQVGAAMDQLPVDKVGELMEQAED